VFTLISALKRETERLALFKGTLGEWLKCGDRPGGSSRVLLLIPDITKTFKICAGIEASGKQFVWEMGSGNKTIELVELVS